MTKQKLVFCLSICCFFIVELFVVSLLVVSLFVVDLFVVDLFVVDRPARKYFAHMETSPSTVKGCYALRQNL